MEDLLNVSKMLDAVKEDKNGSHRVEKYLELKARVLAPAQFPVWPGHVTFPL